MSYLGAENRCYCSFITQGMPSGIYRNLVNSCWVTELNHECIKFSLNSPFCIWLSIWICENCTIWNFLHVCIQTVVLMEMGITESWERVTWILHRRKIPTPVLALCPGEETTLRKLNETRQAHNSGFQNPAACQALCVHSNYERHRNWGTAGLLKATHTSREAEQEFRPDCLNFSIHPLPASPQ